MFCDSKDPLLSIQPPWRLPTRVLQYTLRSCPSLLKTRLFTSLGQRIITPIVTSTYDRIALEYSNRHVDDGSNLAVLEEFADLMRSHKAQSVLDLGCGPGFETRYLSQKGFTAVGIDTSQAMIELANRHAPNSRFECMSFETLCRTPSRWKFDAVWCSRMLIHISPGALPRLLVDLRSVLSGPQLCSFGVIEGDGCGWFREEYDCSGQSLIFFRYFRPGELEDELREAGYHILASKRIKDIKAADCYYQFVFSTCSP